jgi:hypothetical protein
MALVFRICTATVAGQVVTFTPRTGTIGQPEHLTITTGSVTFSANAASEYDTLNEYMITIERRTRT